MRFAVVCLFAAVAAFPADNTGSIFVDVHDSLGHPIGTATVVLLPARTPMAFNRVKRGYSLTGVAPGAYSVEASDPDRGVTETRSVLVLGGGSIADLDFLFPGMATISGKVTDENGRPVRDATVILLSASYIGGELAYNNTVAPVKTNVVGTYRFGKGVIEGEDYRVLAVDDLGTLSAGEDVPADPKARKPALGPAFYPNSKTIEGAAAIVLSAGEFRDGVDIRLSHSAPYCVEGAVEQGDAAGPILATLSLRGLRVSMGEAGMAPGDFRFCGIPAGDYALTVGHSAPVDLNLSDGDRKGMKFLLTAPQPVLLEAAYEGDPKNLPADAKIGAALVGPPDPSVRIPVGGQESAPLNPGRYAVIPVEVPKGSYVKSVTGDGVDILHDRIQVSIGLMSTIRIVLADDGGVANVLVADANRQPLPNTWVHLFPADAASPAILAASHTTGLSGKDGRFTSNMLAPGSYYVLATHTLIRSSPQGIERLWEARSSAQRIEIPAHGSAQVTLEPLILR